MKLEIDKTTKIYRAYFKVKNLVRSCKTQQQLNTALKVMFLFESYYADLFPHCYSDRYFLRHVMITPEYLRGREMFKSIKGLWNDKRVELSKGSVSENVNTVAVI